MGKGVTSEHDAHDAAMEAFAYLIETAKPLENPLGYLHTAAFHFFLKEWRRRYGKRYGIEMPWSLDDLSLKGIDGVPDQRLSEIEVACLREDTLGGLPPGQREVMECAADGLGNAEIASELGRSADAVRRSKSDARKKLRNSLFPDGERRPVLVPPQNVNSAADRAVAISASLASSCLDLRVMNPADRAEAAAMLGELRRLLHQCQPTAFGAQGSAMVLTHVASLVNRLVADRDEETALALSRVSHPLLSHAGCDPAAFNMRRTFAEALSEIGYRRAAQNHLRALSEEERRVFGTVNPETALILLWAKAMAGEAVQAKVGMHALEGRLVQSERPGTPRLLHVQCRHSWLFGQCGQAGESAVRYDGVIVNRSRELGSDHPDVLDARHSKGKMLVHSGAGAQAIMILQAVAEDRARVQGDSHPDTMESLKYFHLARVQAEPCDASRLKDAIAGLEQVLRTQVARRGERHPMSRDTAARLMQLRRYHHAPSGAPAQPAER